MKDKVGLIVLLLTGAAVALTDHEAVCSELVQAAVGQDVALQCRLEPPMDAANMTVEWSQVRLNHSVHLYPDRKDNREEQREPFRGRTSLLHEELTKGNLSLQISSVQLSDAGTYRCFFSSGKLQNSCYVKLTVGNGSRLHNDYSDKVVLFRFNRTMQEQKSSKFSIQLRIIVIAVIVIVFIGCVVIAVVCRKNPEVISAGADCLMSLFLDSCEDE